jgi:hypothetical protein
MEEGFMKCPYPDCTGDVTPGEQFCGECGRALTWQNGQPLAMTAGAGEPPTMGGTRAMPNLPPVGPPVPPPSAPTQAMYTPPGDMAAYTPPSGTPPPATPPPGYVPPADTAPPGYPAPPPPGYTPTGAMPSPTYPAPAAPVARGGPNRLLLIVGGGVAAILLLCLACFGLTVVSALLVPSTPEPISFPTVAVEFPTFEVPPTPEAFATVPAEPSATPEFVSDTPEPSATPEFVSDTPVAPADTPEAVTPNAEATAAASDFDIDFTDYDDASGGVVIVGTVHNKGSDKLENIEVSAELLDASGAVVGTGDDTLLPLATMEGDQTVPFQVTIASPGEGAERIHVSVHADVYDPTGFHVFEPAEGLAVEGDTLEQGTLGPHVTGQVKNNGTQAATLVHVIAAGYDSEGNLVDTGTAFVTSDIAAGETGTFDLLFLRPEVEITKYDLTVLGHVK